MGLPTIAMGILGLGMTPAEAAGILIIPSLVTNLVQCCSGPSTLQLLRRLWMMMAGVVIGSLAGVFLTVRTDPVWSGVALGLSLLVYSLHALFFRPLSFSAASEKWLSPLIGVITGTIAGATGIFVMPAVPYIQSLKLSKEELVQALGISFTVSTIALGAGLKMNDAFSSEQMGISLLTVLPALAGMWFGQKIRKSISPVLFRRYFLLLLSFLGIELIFKPFF